MKVGEETLNFYLMLFCLIIFTSSQKVCVCGGGDGMYNVPVGEFDLGIFENLFKEYEIFDSWRYIFIIPEFCEMDATCIIN